MKKIAIILLFCILINVMAGCRSANKDTTLPESVDSTEPESTGSNAYLDYINKIEVGDSLDKINEVIGSEGEVKSDNATYTWSIDDGGFSAIFREDDTSAALSVELLYDYEDVVNNKVVIKDLDSIKAKVSEGIHYDDFIELLGGVDGVLVSKNSVTNGFVWRSTNGSIVNASFTLDDNICNSFVGTEK